jgi:predicted RNase H-like nuclease (RuvC/YqgF family)
MGKRFKEYLFLSFLKWKLRRMEDDLNLQRATANTYRHWRRRIEPLQAKITKMKQSIAQLEPRGPLIPLS